MTGRALAFAVMAVLVAVGLASLLAHSQVAFATLKWIGEAYLVALGVRLVVRPPDVEAQVARPRSGRPPPTSRCAPCESRLVDLDRRELVQQEVEMSRLRRIHMPVRTHR